MIWSIGFGIIVREIMRVEISGKLLSQQKIPQCTIFKGQHLPNSSSEPNKTYPFLKELIGIF